MIDLRNKAGDAFIQYSRQLSILDDHGYADALWKGVDLYDQAANLPSAISALELFVADRPSDRLAPDALLRLGRAYQAAGLFDKAIGAFQRIQLEYPKSLAASKAAIPLAQAYMAKGPAGIRQGRDNPAERGGEQSAGRSRRRGIPPGTARAGPALLPHAADTRKRSPGCRN